MAWVSLYLTPLQKRLIVAGAAATWIARHPAVDQVLHLLADPVEVGPCSIGQPTVGAISESGGPSSPAS